MRAAADRASHSLGAGRPLWLTAIWLAVAGIAIAANLLQATLRGIQPICLAGDCARVAASPTSRIFGVPISALGLLMFAGLLTFSIMGLRQPRATARWGTALFGLAAFGAAFIGYIVWYQAAILDAVCASCATSLVLLVVLTALAMRVARAGT